MRPVINSDTCIACAACYEVCPAEPKVFEVNDVSVVISPQACLECGACVENCPTDSIKLTD